MSIRPYKDNPAYWQLKQKPVLLLGGSNEDNLFQSKDLREELERLAESGGNYVRNTMSYRDSADAIPYNKLDNGLYDLNEWGDVFWKRFDDFLKWTDEKDIIVQIEVWDRFDFSRDQWHINPFNPDKNINYEMSDSLFKKEYPKHPSKDVHPFFHSIPEMPLYSEKMDTIRHYQEKFVDKMLSYTLQHGNVLYCMNNETTTPVEWGNYWITYIRDKANQLNKKIYITDMYDLFYKVNSCKRCKNLIADPEFYSFVDISQVNSRNFGYDHWDSLTTIIKLRNQYALRPVNHVKIYGGGESGFGSGTNQEGLERFFRNIMGGSAAVRHHRPTSGNGLNEKAIASIKTIRKVEEYVQFWNLEPHMELLQNINPNEAYLTSRESLGYVVYFPKGGSVSLNMTAEIGDWKSTWIDVTTGDEQKMDMVKNLRILNLETPDKRGWFVVITPEDK